MITNSTGLSSSGVRAPGSNRVTTRTPSSRSTTATRMGLRIPYTEGLLCILLAEYRIPRPDTARHSNSRPWHDGQMRRGGKLSRPQPWQEQTRNSPCSNPTQKGWVTAVTSIGKGLFNPKLMTGNFTRQSPIREPGSRYSFPTHRCANPNGGQLPACFLHDPIAARVTPATHIVRSIGEGALWKDIRLRY